jgi:HNH endonuclease
VVILTKTRRLDDDDQRDLDQPCGNRANGHLCSVVAVMKYTLDHNSGCWLWMGGLNGNGYGRFRVNGVLEYAHRRSWKIHKGSIPHGMNVLHRCDNPPCINPDHLFLGTQSDNVRDTETKGRGNHPRGSQVHTAILTEKQVREILASKLGPRALGRIYGVSHVAVVRIKSGKNWKHLRRG